jgi:hypothetical protein
VQPGPNSNPTARDNTLSKWQNELKKWRRGEDPSLRNYANIQCIDKKDDDKIMIKVLIDGMYDEKDVERKGEWIPYYFFLFHDYNPLLCFVSSLPTVIEGNLFPDIVHEQHDIQKLLYNRHFSFEALLRNWRLNDFISEEEGVRIRVHYNFLSLFVHPNRLQNNYLKFSNENKYLFRYEKDELLEILISLYIVKIQELYLKILAKRFEEISKGSWAKELIDKIRTNASIADVLWFIFDEPTEFDKLHHKSVCVQKGLTVTTTITYYEDPLERLRRYEHSSNPSLKKGS